MERITSQEDLIFEPQAGESKSLMAAMHANVARAKLLNGRLKLLEAVTDRKSNRNFYATIIIGVVIFAKTDFTTLAAVAKFFGWP